MPVSNKSNINISSNTIKIHNKSIKNFQFTFNSQSYSFHKSYFISPKTPNSHKLHPIPYTNTIPLNKNTIGSGVGLGWGGPLGGLIECPIGELLVVGESVGEPDSRSGLGLLSSVVVVVVDGTRSKVFGETL